jgi:vacuolar-type H+-ATPase subunit C/Vma6
VVAAVGYAAAQARVRARRARLVDAASWHAIALAADVGAALAALGRALPDLTPSPERLDEAARALRRRQHDATNVLARSVPPQAAELLRWHARRFEVRDLKTLLRTLHARPRGDAPAPPLDTLPAALRTARTVREAVAAAHGTPFGSALAQAHEQAGRLRRSFPFEIALDLAYGHGLVRRIEDLAGSDRHDALTLLGLPLARRNLASAARYRAMPGVRPEEVVSFTLHRDFGGGLAAVQRLAAGGRLVDEAAALGLEVPSDAPEHARIAALERGAERARREAARRRLGRSPFGLGFVLAYLVTLEAECDDLLTLLEAKAAGVDAGTRLDLGGPERVHA